MKEDSQKVCNQSSCIQISSYRSGRLLANDCGFLGDYGRLRTLGATIRVHRKPKLGEAGIVGRCIPDSKKRHFKIFTTLTERTSEAGFWPIR